MNRFISIRWKFMVLGVLLVTVPTVFLGVIIYRTYYTEAMASARNSLSVIARGWDVTATVYEEESVRILRREEHLVERRLASIALLCKKMLETHFENGGEAQGGRYEALLDRLASHRIGRSGSVAVINGQGRYVLSRDRRIDGLSVSDFSKGSNASKMAEILQEARKLGGDEVKVVHYPWADPGIPDARMKMAVFSYYPGADLVVSAEAYYTDYKSYGLKRQLQEELKEKISRQRIGERGYVFVMDTRGRYVVSRDRLRDGEEILDYEDVTGRFPFRELIGRVKALLPGEIAEMDYLWKDLDDVRPKRKMAAVVYNPKWGWLIGATVYEEDVLKGLYSIRWNIAEICLVFILLGAAVAYTGALLISRPVRRLEDIAGSGDLSAVMDPAILNSNDEIGRLSTAFAGMMKSLREKIGEIERARGDLERANEELRSTQDRLVRSEKLAALGRLSAGVAHEINNPLAYVMSNMETLERYVREYETVIADIAGLEEQIGQWRSADDAQADVILRVSRLKSPDLEKIRRDMSVLLVELRDGLDRVRQIVMDLRTFARTGYESMEECALEQVLEQVINIARSQIRQKAELVREYGQVPRVRCSSQRVGQVFMNILVNALQAISGRGTITVRTYVRGLFVCVDIEDTGCGISPGNENKVFEPFFTTKPVGQGTGLGLSISYEIIKKHGGDIRLVTAPGKGSVFTVMLPYSTVTPVQDGQDGAQI